LWGASGAALALVATEILVGVFYYLASGIKILPGREALMGVLYFLPSLIICVLLKGRFNSVINSIIAVSVYLVIVHKAFDLKSLLKK